MAKSIFHYDIIEKVGEGGMGTVYLARDTRLNRNVALKFLPGYVSKNDHVRERFKNEAQAAAALNHPNITQVFSIEEDEDDMCIVMEYIEGQELREKIREGTLSFEQKLQIALQISEGLNSAHQKGIIHRDIKSGNIMIDENGNVKIMDFGLARFQGAEHITKEGSTLGTTPYMSPEQLRGEEADERSDIWSLGVVLYELFTGELPFRGVYEPAIMYSITEEEPEPASFVNSEITPGIEEIIEKCLRKNRADRIGSVSELIRQLKGHIPGGRQSNGDSVSATGFNRKYLTVWGPASLIAAILLFILFTPRVQSKYYISSDLPEERRVAILPFQVTDQDAELSILSAGLYETIATQLTSIEQVLEYYRIIKPKDVRSNQVHTVKDAYRILNANLGATGEIKLLNRTILNDRIQIKLVLHQAEQDVPLDSAVIYMPKNSSLSQIADHVEAAFLNLLQVSGNQKVNETIRRGETRIPDARDLYIRGKAYLGMDQDTIHTKNGIHLFREALKLDPDYAAAFAALGKGYWLMYEQTRNSAYVDSAQNALIDALSLNNQSTSVKEAMGTLKLGTGKYEEALKEFKAVVAVEPKNADAWQGLARSYENLGNLEKAKEAYESAINNIPANWKGYLDLGRFYYRQGNSNEAEYYYDQAAKLSPNNYRLMNSLGGIYYQRGNLDKALEYWQKSIDIKENYAAIHNMAAVQHVLQNYERAAELYKKAVEMRPTDYRIRASLATMYEYIPGHKNDVQTQLEQAIQLAEKELEVNPNSAVTRAYIANYHAEIGNREAAISNLQKALAMDSTHVDILLHATYTYEELGNRGQALYWAEKLLNSGYALEYLTGDRELSELVGDPRFKEIAQAFSSQ